MITRIAGTSFALMALLMIADSARAQADSGESRGPLSVQSGIGFTADPDAFLLGFEADYRLGQGFSAGAMLQLGLDDDFTLVSPAGYLRYSLALGEPGSQLARWRPYVQGGLGFTYIEIDLPANTPSGVDDDDLDFLFNLGLGVEYELFEELSVGSKMLFNVLPAEVFNEKFYFSWELVNVRYRF